MSELIKIITTTNPEQRDRSLESFCRGASLKTLLNECQALERFWRSSDNLYERVRALFFLYAVHRFHLPSKVGFPAKGLIPFDGYSALLKRRFEEALDIFLKVQTQQGPNDAISSALAETYHKLAFQTLADQVRRSVRSVRGNQWMFRTGHPADYPLRVRPELKQRPSAKSLFPILHESTPVRMDLTHSGWSDIFFLGMDYPQGARVINISIDLSVRRENENPMPRPPIETYLRVIDQPILKLTSVDLGASAEISTLAEIFDFARDYLGLLKAAVIAAGIIPPGMEGAGQPLSDLLAQLVAPGHGLEIVTRVNGIPKGSRLAVSTNLLAGIIAVCMRATGQTHSLHGQLTEDERRLVAARAILGEWLGGSGGGWQDSGGVWPGMKLIQGVAAANGDPEFGISRGRLLPVHTLLKTSAVSAATRQKLQDSLVLVHGGMAQDVGPILEMVTEKYLLRSEAAWAGRQEATQIFDEIVKHLHQGEIAKIGAATQRNFQRPLQAIIPWATNLYTRSLIEQVEAEFGEQFWGFWMLGGMSGGGMGFIFDPAHMTRGKKRLQALMSATKSRLEKGVPFAMEPVVYNFAINERGTYAELLDDDALMPPGYYTLVAPEMLRHEPQHLSPFRRAELDRLGAACRTHPELSGMVQALFDRILPRVTQDHTEERSLELLLEEYGFDKIQHEQIRADLRNGRIGLAQNRLPVNSEIKDVAEGDVYDATQGVPDSLRALGWQALAEGRVAVVSLAGGTGSRWTKGAGVVKAINPFCQLDGRHRTFIEVHLAKSRRISRLCKQPLPHIITTSYMTHEPIGTHLKTQDNYRYPGPLMLSPGRAVGLRFVPMARDMRLAWEEIPQQLLDKQAQKVLDSLHAAFISWAQQVGEGSDYTDNLPSQCLHPVGHWYEVSNLLRNGVLAQLLETQPNLKYLMLHNIDTLGADVDPGLLGYHIDQNAALTLEVITRRIDDRGGGLARVNGRLRLIEGLALPREEIEFKLSYYNSLTTWINIDKLLATFKLTRADLSVETKVAGAVRELAANIPTYITLKDVKKRWGQGQEDVFPIAQFEKLWGDMTALPELDCRYVVVPRQRGQQLKEPAQLDGWLRDGSAAYLASICEWE